MSELETLLAQVDADRLMAHVRNITRFERIPDSDEERAAFDCIEAALAACGLSPQRHMLPAYVSIPVRAELTVAGEDIPCTTHSMLPSAELKAELVEVSDATSILHCNAAAGFFLLMVWPWLPSCVQLRRLELWASYSSPGPDIIIK